MPKPEDIVDVTDHLVKVIKNDRELFSLIKKFKVVKDYNELTNAELKHKQVFPPIVIYTAQGQDKAQKALDRLSRYFCKIEGSNKTPRFNIPVTSIITYAQADGDKKNENTYKYLDQSANYALYKPNFDKINNEVNALQRMMAYLSQALYGKPTLPNYHLKTDSKRVANPDFDLD